MKNKLCVLCAVMALLLATVPAAFGQTVSSSVTGTVTDETGETVASSSSLPTGTSVPVTESPTTASVLDDSPATIAEDDDQQSGSPIDGLETLDSQFADPDSSLLVDLSLI